MKATRKAKKVSAAAQSLLAGLDDALAYERGDGANLTVRDVQLKVPAKLKAKDVVKIRAQLRVSQGVFAQLLNVSSSAVRAWEQGARQPSDAALKLLHIARKHPEVLAD